MAAHALEPTLFPLKTFLMLLMLIRRMIYYSLQNFIWYCDCVLVLIGSDY